jgi:hypothetical protein
VIEASPLGASSVAQDLAAFNGSSSDVAGDPRQRA